MPQHHSPMADFARSRVAGRALYRADAFPTDLWQEMAETGLFGIGLPERLGGAGGGYAEIAAALTDLAEMGGSPGFAVAWAAQQMFARATVLRFGNEAQRTALVPAMAAGRLALAFAVSEPGAGAHPKHLNATAERHGHGYRLTGEKVYVTNGPIAGLFVVIAVSAVEPGDGEAATTGRKRFSAFLVPRDTPGLEIVPAPPLGTLRPMTHCMLRMNGCEVPESALLGPSGEAFETLAMPFRDIEDAILTSGFAGTFRRLLRLLAAATDTSDAAAAETAATDLGALAALAAVLDNIAATLAAGLDTEPPAVPDRNGAAAALLAGSRLLCIDLLERMRAYRNGRAAMLGSRGEDEIDFLLADVTTLLSIAKGVRLVKQSRLGMALLRREGRPAA